METKRRFRRLRLWNSARAILDREGRDYRGRSVQEREDLCVEIVRNVLYCLWTQDPTPCAFCGEYPDVRFDGPTLIDETNLRQWIVIGKLSHVCIDASHFIHDSVEPTSERRIQRMMRAIAREWHDRQREARLRKAHEGR